MLFTQTTPPNFRILTCYHYTRKLGGWKVINKVLISSLISADLPSNFSFLKGDVTITIKIDTIENNYRNEYYPWELYMKNSDLDSLPPFFD